MRTVLMLALVLVTSAVDIPAQVVDSAVVLKGHGHRILSVAWSPDGSRVATARLDKTARIWDATSGALLQTLTGHNDFVGNAEWSPDGTMLATSSRDRFARGHTGPVTMVAWSPPGSRSRIVTGGFDSTVGIYPNPLTARGEVEIRTATPGMVRLSVVDVLGTETMSLFDGRLSEGRHVRSIDLEELTVGVYCLYLQTPDGQHSMRLSIVK